MNSAGDRQSSPTAPRPTSFAGGYMHSHMPPAPFPDLSASPVSLQTQSAPDHFTSDDRLMLRLIYYQQQSIQAQLNSVLSWAEQTNARMAALEARAAATQSSRGGSMSESQVPLPSRASPQVAPATPAVQLQSGSIHPTTSSTAAATTVMASNAHNISTASNNTVSEQRSCTPPGASTSSVGGGVGGPAVPQQRPQASSILMNQSSESVTAPWDPRRRESDVHSVAGAVDGSFLSSRVSHLGLGENPLLHSRHSSLSGAIGSTAAQTSTVLHASAAAEGTRVASRPCSRLPSTHNSGLFAGDARRTADTGHHHSTHEDPDRLAWRPAATGEPSKRSRHSVPVMSAPAGAYRDTTVVIAEREVPEYRRLPPSVVGATTATLAASTVNTNNDNSRLVTRTVDDAVRPPASASFLPAHSSSAAASQRAELHTPPFITTGASSPSGTASVPPGSQREQPRSAHVADRDYADTDSLSDGYGSYESRQYIQSIGLL